MALLYEYEPLDLTSNPLYVSTRIIGLKPSTDFRATLQCEILAIRLLAVEQRPPYEGNHRIFEII